MMVFFLIFFLALAAYGMLIGYYRRSWNAIPSEEFGEGWADTTNTGVRGTQESSGVVSSKPLPFISVVVAARNEEARIGSLLDDLLKQDHPAGAFEVVVVDDHSDDATARVVGEHPVGARYFELGERVTGKKQALAMAIGRARGELILTTDADCRVGAGWVRAVARFCRSRDAKMVISPVLMENAGGTAGIFQSLDFMVMQGITGAAVHKKLHMMGNGANLCYPKAVFEAVGGFSGIDDIPSGDDMLLIHKIYRQFPDGVHYLKCAEATATTMAEPGWKLFFQQRIRWASKTKAYRDNTLMRVLALTYVVNLLFVVAVPVVVLRRDTAGIVILLFIAKLLIEYPFANASAAFFRRKRWMPWFILLQPLHILYIVVAGALGRVGAYTWKSRKISAARVKNVI